MGTQTIPSPSKAQNSQKGVKKAKKVSKGLKYRKTPGKYPENTPAIIIRKLVKSCAVRSQKGVKKGSKRGQNSQKGVKKGSKQGYPKTLKKGSKTAKNSQKQPKNGSKSCKRTHPDFHLPIGVHTQSPQTCSQAHVYECCTHPDFHLPIGIHTNCVKSCSRNNT